MTFLVVCGGTAGHVNPGISIAVEIQNRLPESKIIFIGADRPLEKRLVPAAGFELKNIKMTGLRRSISPSAVIYNTKSLFGVISVKSKVKKILKEAKPSAVIGTGGYVCYPVLKAAAKMKIPTFLHESNAKPGMTVRLLSGIVDKIMTTYPGYDTYYKAPDRLIQTGTPLRKEFYERITDEKEQESSDKPFIVSFWGSLGSEKMNEIMIDFIKNNHRDNSFYHTHAAGNSRSLLPNSTPPYADIRDYIDDMPQQMKKADLVICRAGAITLAELTTLGKPSILIPSPHVPDNVQTINAKQLEEVGAAKMIEEKDCTGEKLYNAALELVSNKEKLEVMSEASKKLSAPNATSDIVDLILSLI
ncbi:MAG: undecaprenyldiphospho-muramoylpentapeptide beta-N-acetylglucosaminyltransferase [Oscillospiraceae bacterium]|nr:undecaprenyldiphospho-muramoylpentapeptide beta-N-acetylglucosaminyltransferase [Oscillospiraceae bacterium]